MHRTTTVSDRSTPDASYQPAEHLQPRSINLTRREKEFLQWSEAGKSSCEIAMICSCSEANVNYHINKTLKKFGVSKRHLAGTMARELGLIHGPGIGVCSAGVSLTPVEPLHEPESHAKTP
ncbi:LuxR C-terminal-related transcriptional regulator [Pseudomonas sp. QTF5]|uniref:LuxR C-terminal-related transcriptional regulator n=1 Tax=Pseudomonas sp. QTF5 TaxID=1435425 RepID=UPI0009DEE7FA|nr:LuxR C-terminal-related transcriptional regulator [Pseudomonas sp. QTF5]